MSNNAVELLVKERAKLIAEKAQAIAKFDEAISFLESGIETISGKKVWQAEAATVYDDENPDYVKSSAEEI